MPYNEQLFYRPEHVDPFCVIHGLRKSRHFCLYCCICFTPLVPEECAEEAGQRVDVCKPCAAA